MATTPLAPASFLLTQGTGKHNGQFSLTLAGAYARDLNPDELSPMDETKTLTLTRSSLLLVQLWGGRMQVGAFQSTLHMRNVPLSPFDNGAVGSHLAELSYPRRAALGRSVWPQPEPSFSPGRGDWTSGPGMAADVADSWCRSELTSLASTGICSESREQRVRPSL